MEYWTKEVLIDKAIELAERHHESFVLKADYLRETGVTEHYILKLFDSWTDLWLQAGLEPRNRAAINNDQLIERAHEVFLANGGIPTFVRFIRLCGYARKTYQNRWGTWPSFLTAFREWVLVHDPQFPYLCELNQAIHHPAKPQPSANMKTARLSHRLAPKGRLYGPLLNFRGLLHAPVNECGVVLLFGMVAFELGYIVESVGAGFPDCEAKRRVKHSSEVWEHVRIEFEYQSRNFLTHGHDPEKCDLIVCWHDNWAECPLEVVELKSLLPSLMEQRSWR